MDRLASPDPFGYNFKAMSSPDIIGIAFFALVILVALEMWRRSRRRGDGSDYGTGFGGESSGDGYADGGGDGGCGGGGD